MDSDRGLRLRRVITEVDSGGMLMAHLSIAMPVRRTRADAPVPPAPASDHADHLSEERRRCLFVRRALREAGMIPPQTEPPWRLSPVPFPLTGGEVSFFQTLGPRLWSFSKALNRLYLDSLKGVQPVWVHRYLDQGKPDALLDYARMKRFREAMPRVIRPDVVMTETGMAMTELDSVPGGIGLTGSLSHAYGALGDSLVGGANGMVEGFAGLLRDHGGGGNTGCVAIVVSDEAEDYRREMTWVASQLRAEGLEARCVHPRDLRFTEDALFTATPSGERPVSCVYRFFELFDLKNIPKSELLMYGAKKGRVTVTPPYKPWMEEKLGFALLHHPVLEGFWSEALGADDFRSLLRLMPGTWVVDPSPVPPSAIIPNLTLEGNAVSDWRQLAHASQKQRRFVLKPSGFSELAWGGRGVIVGHDCPQADWAAALERAREAFVSTPYVLQEFHKGRRCAVTWFEARAERVAPMTGRARLSPYYFVSGDEVTLGGILATVCPMDKKVIHGMRDAVMAPCAPSTGARVTR